MRPISRVTLKVDDENVITAGDDTGMELIADCPYATQEMVDTILAGFSGYQYQMFSAEAANIDPAAELGDMVEVDGIRSVLAQISDDGSGYPDISAPGEAETEDEYPSEGPLTRSFNRKIAETRSAIEKTSEQILLAIEGFDGRLSEFSVNIDSITEQVNGLDDAYAALHLEVSGITTKVNGYDGRFSLLEQTLDGLVYTDEGGKVMVRNGSINLTGSITWDDLTSDTQDRVGGVTEKIVHTLIEKDLLASPDIRGAMFSDLRGVNSLTLNWNESGDLIYIRGGFDYFGVRSNQNRSELFAFGTSYLRISPGGAVAALAGPWDFSNVTVTGVTAVFA